MKNLKFSLAEDYKDFAETLLRYSGEVFATASYEDRGRKLDISVIVEGEIRVEFDDEIYKNVGQFPEELIHLLESGDAYSDPRVYIHSNNWLEASFYLNGDYIDGEVFECERFEPEEIEKTLGDFAEWFFENEN